ncbi:heme ABC transporter permease CcmC [Roseateles sp. DB2]|uniref:heme ABC transporter permease CcmC n=1 Tax=Roseateles sp. DB2 TaxID=3453717 RepID=UPI003EEE13CE
MSLVHPLAPDGSPQRAAPRRFFALAAPARFYRATQACAPWLWASATVLALLGLWMGFVVAPTDAVQSEAYRILYIHVPTAWLSMVMYVALAFWAVIGWAWRVRMASMLARAIAPTGALFTAMALWTGACWGKPTWGTWWVWDARLTSELILLFLYLGYLALSSAIEDPRRADQAGALLALVGVVNVPVIYFSVRWWNTLHQGASIRADAAPTMASTMLAALLLMTLAAWAYAFAIVFARARAIALEREHDHEWVAQLRRQEF